MSLECWSKVHQGLRGQQVSLDLQVLLVLQAVLEIQERGELLVGLVSLERMVYQDLQEPSSCCLLGSVLEVTLDKRDLPCLPKKPRCKPSCSRPGWQ